MDLELRDIVIAAITGALVVAIPAVAALIGRRRHGEPLVPQHQPVPPWVWLVGAIMFGGPGVLALLTAPTFLGLAFTGAGLAYLIGFLRARRNV
jgi:drug/metabolite transporter (DMT)-like permease